MLIKASTDYGLRAVLYLAEQGATCSSRDIAEAMSIPRDYLIQLAQLLRNGGIIEARPGKNGGYRLARNPSDITLLQVMDALDEETKTARREHGADESANPAVNTVKRAYALILNSYDAYLDSITISLVLACVQDSDHAREYLANRLQAEGRRLEQAS